MGHDRQAGHAQVDLKSLERAYLREAFSGVKKRGQVPFLKTGSGTLSKHPHLAELKSLERANLREVFSWEGVVE